MKSALAVVLLTTAACAAEEPPPCGAAAVGAPVDLLDDFADVELGGDEVVVLSTRDEVLHARVHDRGGAPLGEPAAVSADADLYGTAAIREAGGWSLLWAEAGELRLATLRPGGDLDESVRWADAGQAYVHMVVATDEGLAAVWSVGEALFLGLDGVAVPIGSGQAPAIASAGDELGLVWADRDREVWFARVSLDGDFVGEPISIGPLAHYLPPGICADGDDYVIAYTVRPEGTTGDVYLLRITGGAASAPVRVSAGDGRSWAPSVACGDGTIAVAWQYLLDGTLPDSDLRLSRIELAFASADATEVTPPFPADATAGVQAIIPRIASDGDGGHLVAWTDFGAAGYRTRLAPIARCGVTARMRAGVIKRSASSAALVVASVSRPK